MLVLLRAGAQVGQASVTIQPGRACALPPTEELPRAFSLSWKDKAATCGACRSIYPCDTHRNVLLFTPSGAHPFCPSTCVGQRTPLLSVSLCVCSWMSLWGICASVSHSVHRHTRGSLRRVSRYTIFQSSGGTTWPLSVFLPASGFCSLPSSKYATGLHTALKAAPVNPHFCDSPLLSKAHVFAAGLQDPERLQVSLVFLSQKGPLTSWPLAISERPGAFRVERGSLSCEEWLRECQCGEGQKAFCQKSNIPSPSGLKKSSLTHRS